MKIVKHQHRQFLESVAGRDGGVDTELICFEASRRDCTRCMNTRLVGPSSFPVACPECSRSD